MTKEQLAHIKNSVSSIKKYIHECCEKGDSATDIMKSLMILEKKCNFYADNFEALNSFKQSTSEESEK